MSEIILLQMTDFRSNHNKYYKAEFKGGTCFVTYGRTGVSEQTVQYSEEVGRRKIREKKAKGYVEVPLHTPKVEYVDTNTRVDSKILDVVNNIFREAGETIDRYLATTVDALSQEAIDKGRRLLAEINRAPQLWLVEEFYNTIPTRLPARINANELVANFVDNIAEIEDRLNQLETAIASMVVQKKGASKYDALGAELDFVEGKEYDRIKRYVESTAVHNYPIRVRDIFSVKIPGERAAFDAETRGKTAIATLFHGTHGANIRHILRTGLVIKQTATNGSMFGRGLYFANKASKSLNYSKSRYAPYRFLLVANVAVGRPHIVYTAQSFSQPPNGYDSVFAKAGQALYNDEIIVYRQSQQTLTHLVLI
ncbi:MAG TPA: hypothetical protein PKD55_01410 [Bellilinea sp.]|nr:hypothetical protein [Bellilinea sp.]